MSKFEYPRLSRPEITAILAQFQIANVSEHQLMTPNMDFVWDLYFRILNHLDSLPEEDHVEFAALEHLENPDFHVDSVRVMKMYSRIKEVVASLDCPRNFTLKDLLTPEADRTEFFLGALLNFCLHRETRLNSITDIVDEVNLLEEQQRDQETKILQLKSEIDGYNEAREREATLVQEVDAKVKELRQTIAALNTNQMSLRATFRKLKEKTGEMDGKISSAEFTLVQSVQENANLRSKVVQSPDKLQRALEEQKLAREEAKNAERSAMQTFHEKNALVDLYSKVEKKMSKHFAQMQAIQDQVNSAKEIEKSLKALKAKLSDEEVLEKSLDVKLVERKGKLEQLGELMKQLEKERDMKSEEASTYLNGVKMEAESKRHDLEERQKNVEAVLAEVDATNITIKSVKESGSAKLEMLASTHEELTKEFQQYKDLLAHVIESGSKAD
ncbi:kinetochore protein NUF2 homolog [Neltuma alba]|uniref:kinetochore protein NUF2 homolog n=1 Tax=Neltuma alba TaxID=207710 RepID=UPI0010A45C51|nr:kinetochore protein NUF2 homolog [Prosopis alba]XP_028753312.1 kinetochore protein NUF2 homolog [Prosopis alba]